MAYADYAAFGVRGSVVEEIKSVGRLFARSLAQSAPETRAARPFGADVSGYSKAMLLPEIDACQSSIFGEMRRIELGRAPVEKRGRTAGEAARLFHRS